MLRVVDAATMPDEVQAEVRPLKSGLQSHQIDREAFDFVGMRVVEFNNQDNSATVYMPENASQMTWAALLEALIIRAVTTGILDDSVSIGDNLHHLDMYLAGKHAATATPW